MGGIQRGDEHIYVTHFRADGDTISRQDAINKILGLTMCKGFIPVSSAIWQIDQLPSAERKGKWIDEGQYAEGHSEHAYYCSQCEEHYIGWIGEFRFCPNCGAKMEGEEE